MGVKRRSSAASNVVVERDPTCVPGKPFLEHLHRVVVGGSAESDGLLSRDTSTRQLLIDRQDHDSKLELVVNAPCLCYLQKLFFTMLTPTASEYSGMITQWRLNAAFAQQLDENPESTANLGAASPQRILQLAGRLLEVESLHLELHKSDTDLPIPSDCNLLMFPKLNRLDLDGIHPGMVSGLAAIAHTLIELRFAHSTLESLISLLTRDGGAHPIKWRNLRVLCVEDVQGMNIEPSFFASTPNLETVEFHQTGLESIGALGRCTWLSVVDLSYNQIHTIDIPAGAFEHLKVLNLAHNRINSLYGLQRCVSLEAIDLSHNRILSLDSVRELAQLQQLRSAILLGNPVAKFSSYRPGCRKLLSDEVMLDRIPWKGQDFDEFTGQVTAVQRESVLVTEIPHGDHNKRKEEPNLRPEGRSFGRGILRSCLAIGFAQLVVSVAWSRDAEAERLTWWIVAATAGIGALSLCIALVVSMLFEVSRSQCFPFQEKQDDDHPDDTADSQHTRVRAISRGLSTKLTVEEAYLLDTDTDALFRVDNFSDSLHRAARAGDDLSLEVLEDVCSHLRTFLAYICGPSGTGIGFAWQRLRRATVCFDRGGSSESRGGELVRERLSSRLSIAIDAVDPSTSFSTSLTKILPVIRLCAIVFSSVSQESDLAQVLRDAYIQSFASDHQWWRQRSILSGIAHTPDTDALLEWLSSTHTHSHRRLVEDLHKCGERLHLLHASIQEFVDEHTHSFAPYMHPNS